MKLTLTTPFAVLLDQVPVAQIRARDETGGFGLRTGHADFLTALSVAVMSWQDHAGAWHHAALSGGILEMTGGNAAIATPDAVLNDDLAALESAVAARLGASQQADQAAGAEAQRLRLRTLQLLARRLSGPMGRRADGGLPLGIEQ